MHGVREASAPLLLHRFLCNSEAHAHAFDPEVMCPLPTSRYLELDPDLAVALTPMGSAAPRQQKGSADEGGRDSFAGDSTPADLAHGWDAHLQEIVREYRLQSYNIMTSNCHAFVVDFMNGVRFQGASNWNMVHLVRRRR